LGAQARGRLFSIVCNAARLPGAASAIIAELRQAKFAGEMLDGFLDGVALHCKNVADRLAKYG
jgi:hypothetical protein